MFQRLARNSYQGGGQTFLRNTAMCLCRNNHAKIQNFGTSISKRYSSYINWKQLPSSVRDNIEKLFKVFEKQFNVVLGQSIQRFQQKIILYKNLYGDRMMSKFIDRIINSTVLQNFNKKHLSFVLSATLFSWQNNIITNEDCNRFIDEMEEVENFINHANDNKSKCLPGGWEPIIDKYHLKVWRKPISASSHLYEYRVFGTYDDIPPRAFFNIQIDLDFWPTWETNALNINIVDRHPESGTEIVHWLTKYPYPMYSREYLYVRRCKEDTEKNVFVVSAKAIEHPNIPETDQYVRVKEYISQFVIRPHKSFDENGFDYVLTYFDDPQSAFPSFCYNWLASSGVPTFVENLHKAAIKMNEKMKKGYRPRITVNNSPHKRMEPDLNKNNNSSIPQFA